MVLGIPGALSYQIGGGYNFKSNETYGYTGASFAFNSVYTSYSSSSGWSAGYTAGTSIYSGLPISTNFGTVGVNYNISHDSWSGNISAWSVDQSGWNFNPSVSAMIFPEQTTNFIRKGKFVSNDKMLSNFVSASDYQGALDYFGFKGSYDPDSKWFKEGSDPGVTDPITGEIFYNKTAFDLGYDKLSFVADHEYWHHRRVVSERYARSGNSIAKDEYLNWTRKYRNQGLYPNHGYEDDIGFRILGYGTKAGVNPNIVFRYIFNRPQWHTIYRIPRRW